MNRTMQKFCMVFLLMFFGCQKKETSNNGAIDFTKMWSVTSSFDAKNLLLVVNLKMDPRVHAYAPSEKIGKPIRLVVLEENGWDKDGPAEIPAGIKKDLGDLGASVVLKNDVAIRQKLKKGNGPGKAILHLQLCTDNACDRPRSYNINF